MEKIHHSQSSFYWEYYPEYSKRTDDDGFLFIERSFQSWNNMGLVLAMEVTHSNSSLALINLLRESAFGKPEFHKKQPWTFDPEVAARRKIEFERVHGYRSMGLVEKLGLGEDGRENERRIQQSIRDEGVPITGRKR